MVMDELDKKLGRDSIDAVFKPREGGTMTVKFKSPPRHPQGNRKQRRTRAAKLRKLK